MKNRQPYPEIVFIAPDPHDYEYGLWFPSASLALASYLHKKSISTEIFDFAYQRVCKCNDFLSACGKIPYSKNKLYGITLYYGLSQQVYQIAKFLRNREPDAYIVLGGPVVMALEERILHETYNVDCICTGEGEHTIEKILTCLKNNQLCSIREIPGITTRIESGISSKAPISSFNCADEITAFNYNLLPTKEYLANQAYPVVYINAGNGCPCKCSFCSTSLFWKNNYRLKSPQKIAEEIELFSKNYGANVLFSLLHDNPFPTKKIALGFLSKFKERGSLYSRC